MLSTEIQRTINIQRKSLADAGLFYFRGTAIRTGERLRAVFQHYDLAGGGGDAEGVGGAVADEPENGVGCAKQPRAAFVEQGKFVVVEIIAQLFAAFHAERTETVTLPPMAQSQLMTKNFAVKIS